MSKKRVARLLIGVILITLLMQTAVVQAQDFTIGKDNSATNVCPGSTALLQTTIHSVSGGTFTISQAGDVSKFSISVPTGFVLFPGESKTIYSYVTPPSSIQPGLYGLMVSVTSGGISEHVDYQVIVEDCRSASLQIDSSKQICPGETGTYKASLSNTGKFSEDYSITIEGQVKDWTVLSDSAVNLVAGEQKNLFVYVTPPVDEFGLFDFTLTATSSSGSFESTHAQMDVQACYDYTLTAEKALYELCEADQMVIPLVLENKGTVSNTYSLSLNAPHFVALEKNLISIASGQATTVNLIIAPEFGIQGDFLVRLTISSDRGEITKGLVITSRVNKCHGIQVEIPADNVAVCNSFEAQQEVIVKNLGRFESTFSLVPQGADFISLSKDSVTLPPEAQESIMLILSPQEGISTGTHTVSIVATDLTSGASATDSLKVSAIEKQRCFLPKVTSAQKTIDVAKDSAGAVSFSIENKGLETSSYELELSGNALPFVQINPSSLILEPSTSETVFLHIAPSTAVAEGNYKVIVTARVKDSQISASETLSINVKEQAETTIITPTPEKEEGKTPLQAIVDFFKNIFSYFLIETTNETVERDQEGEQQQEQPEQVEETGTGETEEEQEKEEVVEQPEETEEPTTGEEGLSSDELEKLAEEQQSEAQESGESFFNKLKAFFFNVFSFESPSINLTNFTEPIDLEEEEETEEEEQEEQEEVVIEQPKETEEEQTGEETESTEEETTEQETLSARARNFLSQYAYHIVAAFILIIIIIIVATGYWKKIVDFFFEEEEMNNKSKLKDNKAKTNSKPKEKETESKVIKPVKKQNN